MNDTICAIATGRGGAIAVVRVSGNDAIKCVDSIFSKDIINAEPNKVIYGFISDKDYVVDDVLLTVFRSPKSYTGEDSVEISCHDSIFITKTIIELLVNNGCRIAEPGEFTKRAFLNGKMDLAQAEAVADIIASTTKSSHRISMQQMRGGISKKLNILTEKLLTMTSLLELELDFSEEDVEFADRSQLLSLASDIKKELEYLVSSFATGQALKNGIPVAIIGAPNVGKSTLLNQLLQDDRAIVSNIKGTTRDVIEDTIVISGTLFRFIDTAGIRHTNDEIERIGIERSIKAAEKAQIIILLNDPDNDFPDIPVRTDQHVIRITNKTEDFQALTGKGLPYLIEQLQQSISSYNEEDIIITSQRHQQSLSNALHYISMTINSLSNNTPSDLIAEDLRITISHLQEITGKKIDSETILSNIFKHFCIGK